MQVLNFQISRIFAKMWWYFGKKWKVAIHEILFYQIFFISAIRQIKFSQNLIFQIVVFCLFRDFLDKEFKNTRVQKFKNTIKTHSFNFRKAFYLNLSWSAKYVFYERQKL